MILWLRSLSMNLIFYFTVFLIAFRDVEYKQRVVSLKIPNELRNVPCQRSLPYARNESNFLSFF